MKPTVQMTVPPTSLLHEYIFTWSFQNSGISEKKKGHLTSSYLCFSLYCLRMITKFTNKFELVLPHLSYFKSVLLSGSLEVYVF